MTIWAIGKAEENARFIEATDPTEVIGYMEAGDNLAPVSVAQKELGGNVIGPMQFKEFAPDEKDEL